MADNDKFVVVTREGEFVPDPAIFDGKERRFGSSASGADDQKVTQEEYDKLKVYKTDEGRQILTKA